MRRWTAWLLAGLALALVVGLVSTRGWRERGAAPTPGAVAPSARPGGQAVAPPPRRRASMETRGRDPGSIAPAEARCLPALRLLVRERTARLATVPDADSQLAAALLEFDAPRGGDAGIEAANARRHRRLAWALELAPGDPVLAAHAHRSCRWDEHCDRSRSLALLVRSDPGNAWTWLEVLAQASAAGDEAGVERALERAARSDGARSYYGQTALRILEPFGELPVPDACADYLRRLETDLLLGRPATAADLADLAIGASMLQSLPEMRPLLAACPAELGDGRRRGLCLHVLARVAAGETLFERLLATSRLVQLTAGAKEGRAWRERYRNLHWLQSEATARRLFQQVSPPEQWARGEVRVMEERLRAADAWPAPAGWLPDGVEARALVLTGRRAPR